jgi:hypothetical protein
LSGLAAVAVLLISGGREDRGADDLRALVDRHVRLAEVTLAVLLPPTGLASRPLTVPSFAEGGLTEGCSSVVDG